MRLAKYLVPAALSVTLVLGTGVVAQASPSGARGTVVSSTPVAQFTQQETSAYLTKGKFTTPVRNGIDAYRVVYRTITPQGRPTTASGVVILPRNSLRSLQVVSYEHGTLADKSEAPSTDGDNKPDRARTMAFAAAGYAAVAPDYLGLGAGPGRHPYTHAPSEASASVDLLQAARSLAGSQHRQLKRKVLVTGFSQGGHAAMALSKALQSGKAARFGLAGTAAISGPYDVQHVETPAGLDGRVTPQNAVYYFGYWLTSMNRIYHLYKNPSEAFQQPYDSRVDQLFDGTHDDASIVSQLPATPQQLLTPKFVAWAQHPTGELLKAMRQSDGTCAWHPRVPVRLYAASGDTNVPIQNARNCQAQLGGSGIPLTDLGNIDHTSTVRVALPQVLGWFEQIAPEA